MLQAVENIYGTGGLWGFLQMPFGDYGPQDIPWPVIPIQISKQYYAMMQASFFVLARLGFCFLCLLLWPSSFTMLLPLPMYVGCLCHWTK